MSAYRTAEQRRSRQVVLCPVCATRVSVGSNDDLRCQGCGARESMLRDDIAPRSEVTLFDVVEASHPELCEAARAFGREGSFAELILRCDGLNIAAGLAIDSGVVFGVDYSLGTAGLPNVTFRAEDSGDVDAKERGVARELQTGDDAFDRAVYIESDAPDGHLQAFLAAPAVRSSIASLVADGLRVSILDGTVSTDDRSRPDCFGEGRIRHIVGALRVIAGGPRSLEPSVEEPRSVARALASLVYVFLPLGIGVIWLASSRYPAVSYGNLVTCGALSSLVVAVALQPLLTRAVRGRSTSHRELGPLRGASFVGLAVLGTGLAILLNGALDRSTEWVETGTVERASHDDEDHQTSVMIRTPSRTVDESFHDPRKEIRKGNGATMWLRRGAFGQLWMTRPVHFTPK